MAKKAFVYLSAVCSKQSLDARRISTYLTKNGYKLVTNPRKADLIVLCTCAVTNQKAKYSLDTVKKLRKYDAELIVAGCLPAIDKGDLDEIFDGKKISTKDLEKFDDLFEDYKVKFKETGDANLLWTNTFEGGIVGAAKRIFKHSGLIGKLYLKTRDYIAARFFKNKSIYDEASREIKNSYYLRISRGCLSNCSYCAIKKAIGPLKSKSINQCVEEFKEGLNKGYKNFLIVADDLGAYGIDIDLDFPTLLNELLKIDGDYEIELEESHPKWIVKALDDFEKIVSQHKIKKICIPIQSGSQRILKLMNRFSDIEKIKQTIKRLKKADPSLMVGTNCIVGFPTEIEEDFEETIRFLHDIRFDYGGIFPFSCKKGTKAEMIEPKVPQEEIKKRMRKIEEFMRNAGYTFFYYKGILMFFSSSEIEDMREYTLENTEKTIVQ